MAEQDIKVIDPDTKQTFTIPGSPGSVKDATDKGYVIDQTARSSIYTGSQDTSPVSKTQNAADLTPEGKYRVIDPDDGREYHIPGTEESKADALAKGYKLASTYVSEDDKTSNYQAKFAPSQDTTGEQFGRGVGYTGGAFDQYINNPVEHALDTLFGVKQAPNTDAWNAVPERYKDFLVNQNVPEEDLPAAVKALENIEEQHTTARGIGNFVGGIVNAAPLIIPAGLAVGGVAAGLGVPVVGGGIGPAIARFGIGTVVNTAIFNGPDVAKNLIVDKDPELATENLVRGLLFNGAFHIAAGSLGHVPAIAGAAKNFFQGKPTSEGTIGLLAKTANAILPDVGAERQGSEVLRKAGYDENTIMSLADTGKLHDEISEIDSRTPKNFNDMSTSDRGAFFNNLSKSAGKEIGEISDQLSNLSEPGEKVKLQLDKELQFPETDVKKNFISDHNRLDFQDWKTRTGDKGGLEGWRTWKDTEGTDSEAATTKTFDQIKQGTITRDEYVDNVSKKSGLDPASEEGKILRQKAIADYENIKEYGKEKLNPNDDSVYTKRASLRNQVDKINNVMKTSEYALEPEIVSFAEKAKARLAEAADSNGFISPSKMKGALTSLRRAITEGPSDSVKHGQLQITDILKTEHDAANQRIGILSGHDDLAARLAYANKSYSIAQNTGRGIPQITNAPTTTGGVGHTASLRGAAVSIPKNIARSWWGELGSYKFSRARYDAVKNKGADPVAHSLIANTIKHNEFLNSIPGTLKAVASGSVAISQIRKEKEDFDGLKVLLGPGANGLSKPQQYQRALEILTDPNMIKVQQQIASESGEKLATNMQIQLAKITAAISAVIKPLQDKQFATKKLPITPTQEQYQALNDVVRLANDPEELFKDYMDKSITPEKSFLVKTLYPSRWAEMIQHADMAAAGLDFTYQNRLFFSMLKLEGIDPSQNVVQQLQAVVGTGTGIPSASSGNGNRRPSGKGATSYALPTTAINTQH